ncbi:hypothetical protein [Salisediminibacterium halotolerans]|uniref:hypothetical protein n=1 Tax=Salisediminibacterium halotolerans TaxID=517425 RepID=UPI000EB03499|nr:hypothetical protein [Salisediminibacterium halotolerans]RLJ72278.1 hypothetical protein BCL39_2177 [Actinophytocola xinjiangensis]RPE85492.1 hypothetical protein EDD67_2312 [Salisediminibacterium halotolerans]TWG33447.1 hypothetical protein BCL52_2172 [Salisediminibacterium halotolerans]GEL07058.1 hypothetical protein SHA02_04740 [Salisediminibacterium halotolerans]
MTTLIKLFLELLRITVIFIGLGGVLWYMVLVHVYAFDAQAQQHQWLGGFGIYIVIYVLYKNKLQYSGWVRREPSEQLGSMATVLFLSGGLLLIAMPYLILFGASV